MSFWSHPLNLLTASGSQNPHLEGNNSDRVLFNGKGPRRRSNPTIYEVLDDTGAYSLKAGGAHGITHGAEFTIYPDRLAQTAITTLRATSVKEFITTLSDPETDLPAPAYAIMSKPGRMEGLRLHVEVDGEPPEFTEDRTLYESIVDEAQQLHPERGVMDDEDPNLVLRVTTRSCDFSVAETLWKSAPPAYLHLLKQPHSVIQTFALDECPHIPTVLESAHQFFFHLLRAPARPVARPIVEIEFFRLEETDEVDENLNLIMKPSGENLIKNGEIDIVMDPYASYAVSVRNLTRLHNLYVALLYFDMTDLAISKPQARPSFNKFSVISSGSWYLPAKGGQGTKVDPPLRVGQTLPIGYGASGSPPWNFVVRDGYDYERGFLKFFISTKYVDFSSIPQESAFTEARRALRNGAHQEVWDTIIIPHIVRMPEDE